jgi:hypothetical protein
MSATKQMGPARRRRRFKALQRAKVAMYEASRAGDRARLHAVSGEFLRIARELGMSDAQAIEAADVKLPLRPEGPTTLVGPEEW